MEGHHTDYEYPLKVLWLCGAHHKAFHAYLRKAGGNKKNFLSFKKSLTAFECGTTNKPHLKYRSA